MWFSSVIANSKLVHYLRCFLLSERKSHQLQLNVFFFLFLSYCLFILVVFECKRSKLWGGERESFLREKGRERKIFMLDLIEMKCTILINVYIFPLNVAFLSHVMLFVDCITLEPAWFYWCPTFLYLLLPSS